MKRRSWFRRLWSAVWGGCSLQRLVRPRCARLLATQIAAGAGCILVLMALALLVWMDAPASRAEQQPWQQSATQQAPRHSLQTSNATNAP